jgi:outer membrane receptor protein involved in Fe transport
MSVKRTQFKRNASVLALAAMALGLSAQVRAADTAAAPAAAAPAAETEAHRRDVSELQEIVVTAQKRATSADKTPISMTAVTGDDLIERGVAQFSALAAETPGVSMKTNGPGQTEFEMRGMTSGGGNSPTVGFYMDDVPLTAPASAQNGKVVIDPSLYDLNHVEVLRGPQGTLYGSSSMGGTIKLVTNQPKLGQFEGSAQATLSATDGGGTNHSENAMLNLPLIKNEMALRLVASQSSTSGWIDRVVVGNFPVATQTLIPGDTRGNVLAGPVLADHKGSNAERLQGGRATLEWKPTDRLTLTTMAFYQKITQDGPSTYDSVPGTQAHYQPFDIAEPYTDSVSVNSFNVNYHFDGFDLTSATSNWHRLSRMTQDNSENAPSCPGGFCATTNSASFYGSTGTGPIFAYENDPSNQFSEELRAASNGDGPLKWLGGVYYAKFQSNWQLVQVAPNPGAFGATVPDFFTLDQPTVIKQSAAFGEATYSPSEQLHVTGGLRVYHYESILDMSFAGFGSPTGNDTPITQHTDQSNTGVNPKFNISYDLDANTMVFATAARGFRPGGGNQPLPSSGPSPIAPAMLAALQALGYSSGVAPRYYGPDHLWSYELGEKAKLMNNHLRVNGSVYFEDWRDIQLLQLPAGYPLYDNINRAHIFGGELEVQAVASQNLTLSAALGYTHATLSDAGHGYNAGQRLPDVPQFTGTVGANYHVTLSDKYEFYSRIEDVYVGNRVGVGTWPQNGNANIVTSTNAPLPGYNLVNLRAGINSEDGWMAALFVNNLTNKHAYLEDVAQLGLPNLAYNRVATNQPRTIGMDVSYHF